ncbi:hypothetical protein [Ideonella oryzae]|uniref:Uncharacterized protein n=1 Tax=Ideonella oryzae TaxID=2937441 RepID=A0ABT1BPH4_9BURK|nr:hypothetical protein [Ideonella oryzae]MCO5978114.1 hypothetical protein [Ideonella oryzae]
MDQALAEALALLDARLAEQAPFTEQELCMRPWGNNASGTPGRRACGRPLGQLRR